MSRILIEKIIQHLSDLAPKNWESIYLKCEIDDDLTQFDARYNDKQFLEIDFELNEYFEMLREECSNNQQGFNQVYLSLTKDGKYDINFGYDPVSW